MSFMEVSKKNRVSLVSDFLGRYFFGHYTRNSSRANSLKVVVSLNYPQISVITVDFPLPASPILINHALQRPLQGMIFILQWVAFCRTSKSRKDPEMGAENLRPHLHLINFWPWYLKPQNETGHHLFLHNLSLGWNIRLCPSPSDNVMAVSVIYNSQAPSTLFRLHWTSNPSLFLSQ